MKRALVAAIAGTLLFQLGAAHPSAQAPALTFFKNYFLTGDHVVGGTSLWRKGVDGLATATIEISGVPEGVDVAAAFLYVQTAEMVQWSGIDQARFNGVDLGPGTASIAKALNWDLATPPCWSVNWGGGRRLVTYRADVLRMLPIGEHGDTQANGTHTLQVPDFGISFPDTDEGGGESGGSTGPRAIGASLIIVYRDSAHPFRGTVIYDGGVTKTAFATIALSMPGFYQASAQADAKMTAIVGDGRAFLSERVWVDGQLIATNPFASTAGPKWDTPTFENLPIPPGASSATVQVTPNGLFSDCLSISAWVLTLDVQDTDGDGLIDIWESSDTPVLDPNGQALPNLKAMGADPEVRDIFVEIGYTFTEDDPSTPEVDPPTYGGVAKPAHTHRPDHPALKLAGDMFWNAPTGRINVHFDLGEDYPHGEADPYIIRGAGLARGGEAINELATVCTRAPVDPPHVCQYSEFPGTFGWKTGFEFAKNEILSGPPPGPDGEDPCDAPAAACERRFDRNRKDIFRYALFAHAVGLPKSEDPNHPDFHVPRTFTGVGDFPGGDFMVTLGAFDDDDGLPVGTPFMQASTMVHEKGHGFERRHGGEAFEPNCKMLYFSPLNYLYQLRGLLDDDGVRHLDYSREDFTAIAINEQSLFDGSLPPPLPYRIGWYAPLSTSYLGSLGTPVSKHCDGSPLLPTDVPMVRIDARTKASAIDWKANATTELSPFSQDVNFNGRTTGPDLVAPEILAGSDDWSRIVLNQVGARRSAGGLFFDSLDRAAVGPLSLDAGRGDLGRGDLGRGDLGRGDLGRGDLGRGDLGRGDLGRGDLGSSSILGRGDLGRGDLGGGDLFVGGPGEPIGELDFETAGDLAKTPPAEFRACVIGESCVGTETPLHRVRMDWTSPNVGGVDRYDAWRVLGPELTPAAMAAAVLVGQLSAVSGQVDYFLIDQTPLVDGQEYTYFSRAIYTDGTISDPSNIVTILAVNDPPVAAPDSYSTNEDTTLNVAAPGVLGNDTDDDGGGALQATLVSGPSHGTLALNGNGSFTYTPAANFHGSDSFTYKASNTTGESIAATASLTINPVNDAPTISDIANRTIHANSTTGPVAFTVGDVEDEPSTLSVSGVSSNTTLVPNANIVFGGAGANRTVTVTPAANKSGSATITVTVTDGGGLAASDSFVLTVKSTFTFVNVQNAPPPAGSTFKAGSSIPMKWAYKNGSILVDSANVAHAVTVRGPLPSGPVRTFTNTDSGSSSFRYTASSKTWTFNLQTKEANGTPYPVGTYEVTITPMTPGFQPSPTFQISLAK
jgi:hypothetical protein